MDNNRKTKEQPIQELKDLRRGMAEPEKSETEPQQNEDTLQDRERYLRLIADNIPAYVAYVDSSLHYRFINRAYEDLFGKTRAEIVGQPVSQVLGEVYFENVQENIHSALSGRKVFFESPLSVGGKQIFLSTSYIPDKDAQGVTKGLIVLVVDISERKRAEEELRKRNKYIETILDNMPIGLAINTIADGVARYLNNNFTAIYGWPKEVLTDVSQFFEKVYPGVEGEKLKARVLSDMSSGDPKKMFWDDLKITTGTGEHRYISAMNIPILEQNLMISTVWDTTRLHKSQEALREQEEKYRNLFNNAEVGIFRSRLDGSEVLEVNRQFLDIVGMTAEETLGKPSVNLWADPKERQEMVKRLVADGSVSAFEYKMLNKKQGETRNCLTSLRLYREEGILEGSILDITERKRAEEEKIKLEAQLQQAQKMESVGRLAGGVAHDFNNMLGAILGHAELAIEQVDPAQPLHAHLEEIQKAARRSADLTRQLLAFARKQTISPKVLDLNETIEGILKMLRRLIGEDIHLAWLPGASVWPVKVDPSQLDQILANLCVNARDAIADVGRVTIETGNRTLDEAYCADYPGLVPGEYVQLTLSDDGCGMDRKTLAHIFEPFFTTKGVGEGTGLGLATVYGVVKQNKGFINVYSEPGQGTTFTIYLPRQAGKTEPLRTKGAAGPVLRGHETILLVEDEPSILKLTTVMLERQGYTVRAAGTPGEALRLAREHAGEIHLLMTDVVMPEMNGRDLAKNLLSLYPNLKRLFMSGYTANVIAHHGVMEPGVYFLQKPFSIIELADKVREALDSK